MLKYIFYKLIILSQFANSKYNDFNLHPEHLPYYYYTFQQEADSCRKDVNCPYKHAADTPHCWGYEEDCPENETFLQPICSGDHRGWVKTKHEQTSTFFNQADFGHIREHRNSIQVICEPTFREDSVLECSEHLQFCRGRNLILNLTRLDRLGTWRYRMDVLEPGDLAGFCHIHEGRLENRSDHMSPLQSWAPEMRNFRKLPGRLQPDSQCDIWFDKPTFIVKIDATVNMYHHLCDFFNLYASLHVNNTHTSMFSTDVNVIIWETYPYHSAFRDMWVPFTRHDVTTLADHAGKTLCFRNVVFPLLPRMIFGLYYNTPLIYGCERSGLFKAFTQHVLHRLNITSLERKDKDIRVTFLSRETSHRNILNEGELLAALKSEPGVQVKRVVFSQQVPFREQLAISHGTDLFIGMHGAGLTHLLFLPDWAAIFEVYNCEDESCYADLARLRGVKYATWENREKITEITKSRHPDGGFHAKFVNYSFDPVEFMTIVRRLLNYVRSHPDFGSQSTIQRKDEL